MGIFCFRALLVCIAKSTHRLSNFTASRTKYISELAYFQFWKNIISLVSLALIGLPDQDGVNSRFKIKKPNVKNIKMPTSTTDILLYCGILVLSILVALALLGLFYLLVRQIRRVNRPEAKDSLDKGRTGPISPPADQVTITVSSPSLKESLNATPEFGSQYSDQKLTARSMDTPKSFKPI